MSSYEKEQDRYETITPLIIEEMRWFFEEKKIVKEKSSAKTVNNRKHISKQYSG